MAGRTILVTGAAGFLGSHLAVEAALAGHRVIALARGHHGRSAGDRFHALGSYFALRLADHSSAESWPLPGIRVVEGDVEEVNLGLGRSRVRRLFESVDEVLHCAARVDFTASQRDAVMATNLGALDNLLPWITASGPTFNLVSTAYVAPKGRREPFPEQPVDRQRLMAEDFRNPYEASKAAAETRILDTLVTHGRPWRILRPGILLGDSVHGRTTSFNALYVLLEVLDLLHRQLMDSGEAGPDDPARLRIQCDPEAGLGLLPVDWAARAALALLGRRDTVGNIFHLTQPRPLTHRQLGPALTELFPGLALEAVGAEDFAHTPADRREALVARGLRTYRPYLEGHPRFADDQTTRALETTPEGPVRPCPPVDVKWLESLVAWGRRMGWGRRHAADVGISNAGQWTACRSLFEDHLGSRRGQILLPGTRRVNLVFDLVVVDLPGFRRRLEILNGELIRVEAVDASAPPVACRYELASDVLLAIARGRLDPRQAFFARKAEIRGDLESGMRMASLMVDFFRRYPLRDPARRRPPRCIPAERAEMAGPLR